MPASVHAQVQQFHLRRKTRQVDVYGGDGAGVPDLQPVVLQDAGESKGRRAEREGLYIGDVTVGRGQDIRGWRPWLGVLACPHRGLVLFKRGDLVVPDVGMVGGGDVAAVEFAHGLDYPDVFQPQRRKGVGYVAALALGGAGPP